MGYIGKMQVMNIEMMGSCSRMVLTQICEKCNLTLDSKYDAKSGRDLYSVEGSEYKTVKEATAKAIFEAELNGYSIENMGIKNSYGFNPFTRIG